MSVVIDARGVHQTISGIDRYVLGLLRGFDEAGRRAAPNIKVLARPGSLVWAAVAGKHGIEPVSCPWSPWSIRSQAKLPRMLRSLGCSVYHAPHVYGPLRGKGFKRVVTVHDLIPHVRRFEMARSLKSRVFPLWDQWFRAQCAVADRIITVSDFSKRQLTDVIGVPSERIERIHNGVDAPLTFDDPNESALRCEELRRRFRLRGRVITYIGRHDPYKNLAALVKAFGRALPTIGDRATLVIGGREDRRYQEAQEARLTLTDAAQERVVFTDYLDERDRIALLRSSDLFVFPSRHEGFGLPPLEAMAAEVPVVAARATSLPEVLEDAALLVEPDDIDGLARAMAGVLNDPSLGETLRRRGLAQAARFSWQRCAEHHSRLYASVAAG